MGLIYTNSAQVVEYKVFGVYMYAVEYLSIDCENISSSRKAVGWFYTLFAAIDYAKKIRQGGAE